MRVLTGINTTGTPHLGNYVGSIRPAIEASRQADVDAFYFMADYHALIKCDDAARVNRSRLEVAATWLACGLDPERVTFYRQSDIPEITELSWLLTCVTAKGLLNRAHAYKAAVDRNTDAGEDPDAGVSTGLYMYPVLMAADILAFNANRVPVGRDQIQHLEMARDIAQRFNHVYGGQFFVLPEAAVEEGVGTLPGLDGRKMSKSYDNTVPLFDGGSKRTRKAIMRIVTDSRTPGEPKDPDSSSLYALYRAFTGDEEAQLFRRQLEEGLGWGDAKKHLVARLEEEIGPMRERYDAFIARPDDMEDILRTGAQRARTVTAPLLARLREAVGLRSGATTVAGASDKRKGKTGKSARVTTFRDEQGQFRFAILAGSGEQLARSAAHADPKAAGLAARELQNAAATAVVQEGADGQLVVLMDGTSVAFTVQLDGADQLQRLAARLRDALQSLAG